ncbi:MAG TPA: hypothetical protein VHC43_02325 [Mycobacteriales bacterium]|nr:hypothetical protein [Mycobacteriales bacterium]
MGIRLLARPGLVVAWAAVSIGGFAAVGGAALTSASARPAARDGSCGPAHTYIDAEHATVKAHRVVVTGKAARLHCGGPDDSSYITGSATTVKLLLTATVKVWKMPEDPSQGTKTVSATKLPHWLKVNRSEPIYKVHGPSHAVTKLVEEWHP